MMEAVVPCLLEALIYCNVFKSCPVDVYVMYTLHKTRYIRYPTCISLCRCVGVHTVEQSLLAV